MVCFLNFTFLYLVLLTADIFKRALSECGSAFIPENGKYCKINGPCSDIKQQYIEGDTVKYECDKGYMLVGGNVTRACQKDGKWSGQMPFCEKRIELRNQVDSDLRSFLEELTDDKAETCVDSGKQIDIHLRQNYTEARLLVLKGGNEDFNFSVIDGSGNKCEFQKIKKEHTRQWMEISCKSVVNPAYQILTEGTSSLPLGVNKICEVSVNGQRGPIIRNRVSVHSKTSGKIIDMDKKTCVNYFGTIRIQVSPQVPSVISAVRIFVAKGYYNFHIYIPDGDKMIECGRIEKNFTNKETNRMKIVCKNEVIVSSIVVKDSNTDSRGNKEICEVEVYGTNASEMGCDSAPEEFIVSNKQLIISRLRGDMKCEGHNSAKVLECQDGKWTRTRNLCNEIIASIVGVCLFSLCAIFIIAYFCRKWKRSVIIMVQPHSSQSHFCSQGNVFSPYHAEDNMEYDEVNYDALSDKSSILRKTLPRTGPSDLPDIVMEEYGKPMDYTTFRASRDVNPESRVSHLYLEPQDALPNVPSQQNLPYCGHPTWKDVDCV